MSGEEDAGPPVPPWRNSKAKAMLVKMIADGFITEKTDKVALFESDPEFLKWDKDQFKRNLKALFNAAKNPKKKDKPKWGKVKQESC